MNAVQNKSRMVKPEMEKNKKIIMPVITFFMSKLMLPLLEG
jgi:hypothetical protein